MNTMSTSSTFLKHISFWYNKTDDECVELATTDGNLDASQALSNILERDFCIAVCNDIVEKLTSN